MPLQMYADVGFFVSLPFVIYAKGDFLRMIVRAL